MGRAGKLLGAVATTIVILAFFAGLVVILRQQVIPVREQYQSLKSDCHMLEGEYAFLASRFSSLQQSHQELVENYRRLEENYTALLKESAEEKAKLEAEIASLRRLLERYQETCARYKALNAFPKVIGSEVRGGEDRL